MDDEWREERKRPAKAESRERLCRGSLRLEGRKKLERLSRDRGEEGGKKASKREEGGEGGGEGDNRAREARAEDTSEKEIEISRYDGSGGDSRGQTE